MNRVKYIYDHQHTVKYTENGPVIECLRVPVACVVCVEGSTLNLVGVSVCCNGSYWRGADTFNKKRAVSIATGRALTGSDLNVPKRKIRTKFGKQVLLQDEVNYWANKFVSQPVEA